MDGLSFLDIRLPYELGFFKKAVVFDAGNNKLTSPVPFSLGCLEKLEVLNFAGNLLYGTVPEVHVAGLKTETGKMKLWGSRNRQKSGSRWLLANGMGKKKHPLMKSKVIANSSAPASSQATTTVQPGDTLWNISSRVHGTRAKSKEFAALNPYTRNPNVVLSNEKIRLC
ncbi:Hypothetical predicted protein [Olea europaea subsp. europaea]|uniref:LysM domain-containing protein n=1 Tax=Olea europaea subsp. europaea TaxID=158383 RepID=A0A8S0R020_OLEEU|nr:Hypothetical predicted protein [Olea europaea subsp. europaea]